MIESTPLFSEIFYKSPAILTLTVPADGRIVDVNDTFLQYTDYSREEVIGRTTMYGGWPGDRAAYHIKNEGPGVG